MKVYSCPKEVPEPVIDYGAGFDTKKMQAAEDAHAAKLKAHLIGLGYKGKHTGEILSIPHADGAAQYMLADGPKSALIHLPYGDAWHSPHAEYMPKKVVLERINRDKKIGELFAKKTGT